MDINAVQSCASLLFKENRWEELEKLSKSQIDMFGYAPNLFYIYGKSLFEQKNYLEAIKIFNKCKIDLDFNIDQLIIECTENISEDKLYSISSIDAPIKYSLEKFENDLDSVLRSISDNSRMIFWKYDKDSKKHIWDKKPEEIAKHLVIQGLVNKYSKNEFEIIEEVPTGPGRIDLYIILPNRMRVILELKMCGSNYSSGYALSGNDQLISYLDTKHQRLGYLVVFDGRKRDFSNGLNKLQYFGNKTIISKAVDIRPVILKNA